MYQIDQFSFVCGAMDCFNEVLAADVKNLAFGSPEKDKSERDRQLEPAIDICKKYGTKYYVEDEAFLTDLFPLSANQDTYLIIFYKHDCYIEQYLELKRRKADLVERKEYKGEARFQIAYDLGKLLSYSDEAIQEKVEKNTEKEVFDF